MKAWRGLVKVNLVSFSLREWEKRGMNDWTTRPNFYFYYLFCVIYFFGLVEYCRMEYCKQSLLDTDLEEIDLNLFNFLIDLSMRKGVYCVGFFVPLFTVFCPPFDCSSCSRTGFKIEDFRNTSFVSFSFRFLLSFRNFFDLEIPKKFGQI